MPTLSVAGSARRSKETIGVLIVMLPPHELPALRDAHLVAVAAVARHLSLALSLQRAAEEALRPPAARLSSGGVGGSARVAGWSSSASGSGCGGTADPSMPSLAASLGDLMLELEPEQAASLGKMLARHPTLGDEVLGNLTDAAHAEAAAAISAGRQQQLLPAPRR